MSHHIYLTNTSGPGMSICKCWTIARSQESGVEEVASAFISSSPNPAHKLRSGSDSASDSGHGHSLAVGTQKHGPGRFCALPHQQTQHAQCCPPCKLLKHLEIHVRFRFPRVLCHDLPQNVRPPRLAPRSEQCLSVFPPGGPKPCHLPVQNAVHISRLRVD
jgi:hypothetical protein